MLGRAQVLYKHMFFGGWGSEHDIACVLLRLGGLESKGLLAKDPSSYLSENGF